jgi:survival-of-motor-neuron-related-splicing factor 30
MSDSSVADLEEQVNGYREQLADIDAALAADAQNEELLAVKSQLVDVLQLTTDLLATARQQQQAAIVAAARAAAASFNASNAATIAATTSATAFVANNVALTNNATTTLVPLLTHHTAAVATSTGIVGSSQTTTNNMNTASTASSIAPGTVCKAIWSGDGELYTATIKRLLPNGDVVVQFEGYTDDVTVKREAVQLNSGAAAAAAAAAASKKRKVEDPYAEQAIPASLTIQPSDSAEERERKKKRVKAIKSANRQKRIEKEKNESAQSWQKFISKKASSKAVSGFSTGKKTKKSMFASPDTVDGKVGVTNSGQGLTEVNDRKVRMRNTGAAAETNATGDDDSNDSE